MGQFDVVFNDLRAHHIGKARHKGHEMFAPFKVGDIVRLKNGNSPIQVLEVEYFESLPNNPRFKIPKYSCFVPGWYIRYKYVSTLRYSDDYNDVTPKWRIADGFTFIDPDKENAMTLYQTKEAKPRFGTLLTKNSKGQFVLEMKGKDGEVETFDPLSLEEVMPYTVRIRRFSGGEATTQSDYEMVEGIVEVGDVLMQLSNAAVWEVIAVNTKCRNPSQSKNGFFLLEGKRL